MSQNVTSQQREGVLDQIASGFVRVDRNPLSQTPDDAGIKYESMGFQASDGVNLKGWFMPSAVGNKLVIFNHFMMGNRAGAVAHPAWGNVHVDFMPIYTHLISSGYSVFSYDLRNHGESDVVDGGRLGLTHTEYQDVIGAMRFVKERFPEQELYLYSQCYGTVSTIRAMQKSPTEFESVRAFVNVQPLTGEGHVLGTMAHLGMAHEDNLEIFDRLIKEKTGQSVNDSAVPADAVKIPTLTVQVKNDWRTTREAIQDIHDRISSTDKKLYWIEGLEERLEGYNHFGREPAVLLEWLNSH